MESIIVFIGFLTLCATILLIGLIIAYALMRSRVARLESRVLRLEKRGESLEELNLEEEALEGLAEDQRKSDMVSQDEYRDHGPKSEPELVTAKEAPEGKPKFFDNELWWEWFEEVVGKRWMTWVGALALFLSCGFFLKHAFESGWIGPTGRVIMGLFAGCVLLFAGDTMLRKRMRALGQGLMGAGLAILYISIFAGFSIYDLIPQSVSFISMIIITAAGMALAILHNALPLAFIAVLGGFLTPPMLSTGRDARDVLFLYVALLDLGVLAAAFFRKWRPLFLLGFIGTWIIFTGWYESFYKDEALIPTLIWVSIFYVIFLLIPFAYQLRKREAARVEQFGLSLANAAIAFTYFYILLVESHKHVLGFMCLAMAASYLGLAYLTRSRIPQDKRALFGFVGLCVVFLTLAAPLHLKFHGVTMAWSVEGPVLVFLGYLFLYRPVRIAGFAVLAVATARLFISHWPLHTDVYQLFLNRQFAAGFTIAVAFWVYSLIHYKNLARSTYIDKVLMTGAAIIGGFLALVICHWELAGWLRYKSIELDWIPGYLGLSLLILLWSLGAALFGAASLRFRSPYFLYSSVVALLVAIIMAVGLYEKRVFEDRLILLNLRFICCLAGVGASFVAAYVAWVFRDEWKAGKYPLTYILFPLSGLLLLFLLSAEVYTYFIETALSSLTGRRRGQMSLSIVWGAYAIIALAIGFYNRLRPLRVAGLGLLGVTAVKVALLDLAGLDQIYRIVSLVVLGGAMIGASFLYHRLEKHSCDVSRKGAKQ
jgi:uncharacterized membrane protein